MKKYILKKLLSVIPIMLAVSIITFALVNMSSGDTAEIILRESGVKVSEEGVEMIRKDLGLDKPLTTQYMNWIKKIIKLDFGKSYISGLPVKYDLFERLLNSAKLSLCGLILLIIISLPLGIISSLKPKSFIDKFCRLFSFASASIPSFWIGLMLLYVFGVKLKLISVIGTDNGLGILIPAFTLAVGSLGVYIRLIRANMIEELNKSYIKAARAKGLMENTIIIKHALKNAILPILTKFGITIGSFLGGSTIIEIVFSYRGLGTYIMDAITNKDYPVIQAYVILIAAIVVIINLIVDILYVYINPKIELK